MTTVPLEEAQRQLAKLLQQVAAGEEMVITQNGKPVARIVPEPSNPPGVANGSGTDLNRFAGSITLREDPGEYQKRMRDEWD